MSSILAAIKGGRTLRELRESDRAAYKAYRAEVNRRYWDRNREALNVKEAQKRLAAGMQPRIPKSPKLPPPPKKVETDAERRARLIANKRRWRERHPERSEEQNRRWREKNPEKVRASVRRNQHRRRAEMQGVKRIPFSGKQLRARLSMYGGCWICGGAKQEADHVKPLSIGGYHCLSNLRPICKSCNARKNNRWPLTQADIRSIREANVRPKSEVRRA